jgi:hypothetical protein
MIARRERIFISYGVSGTGIYTIDPNTGMKTLVASSFDTRSLLEVNVDTGVTTNLDR